MIISITGAPGCGKTTIINKLKEERPSFNYYKAALSPTSKGQIINSYRTANKINYDLIQMIYINSYSALIEQVNMENKIINIIDRGIEEIEAVSNILFRRKLLLDYDSICRELDKYHKIESDIIVFIQVDEKNLSSRIESRDKKLKRKKRPKDDSFMKIMYEDVEKWFLNNNKCIFIENNKSINDLLKNLVKIIDSSVI